MKKWGLNVSSCVVLVGIGMCMVVLRMLGRRPGGGGGFGVGRMVGHGVMMNDRGR
ncbi:hypothetical protein AGABI2DRAFT_177062 [Agaricus bisporus var. bisporus H97]|uniref:hypothetical protein n=1 Tax=Agaricus bisporus var. bisporus (strain H97 / ATCC MYA-4626 / FGSC 10389) TaxID=936046 RepID=UPI00029F79ED|nr:hypothetical protein AGABI2DRAFT_177062 [Agaricus bisporus var. bisporus H97]EKV48842.1 hypothetical protein AGABI2DRAFT_177062 [Agaricus bisporus var. bisporus H97]